MSRRSTVFVSVALLTACASTQVKHTPERVPGVSLRGAVVLADGRAVPRIDVFVNCQGGVERTVADAEGHFEFDGLKATRCTLQLGGTSYTAHVDLGRNLMRAAAPAFVRVVYPPRKELRFTVSYRDGATVRSYDVAFLDGVAGARLTKDGAFRGVIKHPETGQAVDFLATAGGVTFSGTSNLSARGVKIVDRGVLPPQLRTEPMTNDLLSLAVAHGAQLTTLGKLLGKRTLLWVGSCSRLAGSTQQDLMLLGQRYGQVGLRTLVLLRGDCGGNGVAIETKRARYYVGQDASWALQVGRDQAGLMVIGDGGTVAWRSDGLKTALQPAVAFLKRSWPLFAATQRVSVQPAESVSTARVKRLMEQANKLARAGRLKEAHALLDSVINMSPANAEAHKQRALMKASLGDVCGAMTEVGWWRDEFGDDSADDLLDEVRKRSRSR